MDRLNGGQTPMAEITSCPSCKVKLQLPESVLGLEVKCPQCGQVFRADPPVIQGKLAEDPATYRPGSPPAFGQPFSRLDEDGEEEYRLVRGPLGGVGRATAAIIMLVVSLFLDAIDIAISFLYIQEINKMIAAGPFGGDDQQVQTLENLIFIISMFELVVGIATAVVFLMWIYSAYANLESLGSGALQYSSGWAVGYFFIPILNLFRPLQVVQEIWRTSDPEDGGASNSALAGFWWACWILGNILGYISIQMTRNPQNTLELIRSANTLHIVSTLISITGGILLIFLIKGIMRRQTEKFERLVSRSAPY